MDHHILKTRSRILDRVDRTIRHTTPGTFGGLSARSHRSHGDIFGDWSAHELCSCREANDRKCQKSRILTVLLNGYDLGSEDGTGENFRQPETCRVTAPEESVWKTTETERQEADLLFHHKIPVDSLGRFLLGFRSRRSGSLIFMPPIIGHCFPPIGARHFDFRLLSQGSDPRRTS